ncbi:MAG: glycosyltransferase, partial [Bacteroidota bacterium]|nr:glycosyltransferase [Bacteroidota bacterium]
MFNTILNILFILVLSYCGLSVIYLFILSLAGKLFYKEKYSRYFSPAPEKKIAILVPAYKEDGIILSTAYNLLQLAYPRELFDIYIIADSFQKETIASLKELPLEVFEVSFTKSTKTKALNEAFKRIQKSYDIALICDADNMLAKNFLQLINNSFVNGAKAVQGKRVA